MGSLKSGVALFTIKHKFRFIRTHNIIILPAFLAFFHLGGTNFYLKLGRVVVGYISKGCSKTSALKVLLFYSYTEAV